MHNRTKLSRLPFDPIFFSVTGTLLTMGLLMVASSSIALGQKLFGQPFYFFLHQAASMTLGLLLATLVFLLPIKLWYRLSGLLLLCAIFLLVLVLVPGMGRVVNGSARWLHFGVGSFQVSEFAKLAIVMYVSSYVVRHQEDIKHTISGFIRPMLVLSVVGALLVLEPDFGTCVVILSTALAMLFLAGVPLWQYMVLLLVVAGTLGFVAISAPYRLERLTSFLDPWAVPFDSGYQLTQALIAFGRGEWFGVGLGSSVQKLFYLPESHTDFVFAVLAEEWGFMGALAMLALYVLFVWRGMMIGYAAEQRQDRFAAFLSYGISLWVGLQTLVNIGVNIGVLPTKGLTLPFLSYGGNSILVLCMSLGLLARIDYENRLLRVRERRFVRSRFKRR